MQRRTIFIAVLVIVAVATIASQFASSAPDGLERVADDAGILGNATETPGVVDGYGDGALETAAAGLAGVAITLALGWALFWLIRRNTIRDGS